MAKDHVLITCLDHSTQCQVKGKALHSWDSLLSPEWGAEGRPGTLHLFLGTTMTVTLPLLSPAWSMTPCFPTTGPPSSWGRGASCWLGFSSAHPQSLGNAGRGEKPHGAGTNALFLPWMRETSCPPHSPAGKGTSSCVADRCGALSRKEMHFGTQASFPWSYHGLRTFL